MLLSSICQATSQTRPVKVSDKYKGKVVAGISSLSIMNILWISE